MDCRELVNKCTGDRRCPVESFQQRALADFSPSTPAVLQVFSRRAVGPAIILRPAAVLLSCCEIHTLAMRSSRIFTRHARGASGILKTRSRPGNFSATGCRAVKKYTGSRRGLVDLFAKHTRGASGILKTRNRPCNFSAAGCQATEKYKRSRRALADFSPSTPAVLQVFSRREVGPAIILRPATELLRNTHARDAL